MATSLRSNDILFNDTSTQPSAARVGIDNITTSTNVTLTSTSKFVQIITPTIAGLSIILPNTTTLVPSESFFKLTNNGYYDIDVKTSSGIRLFTLSPLTSSVLNLNSNGSANVDWGYGIYLSDTETSTIQGQPVSFTALTSSLFIFTYFTASAGINSVAVSYSGGTATWGTPIQHSASGGASNFTQYVSTVRINNTSFIVTYNTSGTTCYARACSVSGTTITGGTAVACSTASSQHYLGMLFKTSDSMFVLTYSREELQPIVSYFRVITVSGTTVTVGALNSTANQANITGIIPLGDQTTNFVVVMYYNNSIYRSYSTSGTTPTLVSSGTLSTSMSVGPYFRHTTGVTYTGGVFFNYSGATINSVSYANAISGGVAASFIKEDSTGKYFGFHQYNDTIVYGDFSVDSPAYFNGKFTLTIPTNIYMTKNYDSTYNAYCNNAGKLIISASTAYNSTSGYLSFVSIDKIV